MEYELKHVRQAHRIREGDIIGFGEGLMHGKVLKVERGRTGVNGEAEITFTCEDGTLPTFLPNDVVGVFEEPSVTLSLAAAATLRDALDMVLGDDLGDQTEREALDEVEEALLKHGISAERGRSVGLDLQLGAEYEEGEARGRASVRALEAADLLDGARARVLLDDGEAAFLDAFPAAEDAIDGEAGEYTDPNVVGDAGHDGYWTALWQGLEGYAQNVVDDE